MIRAGQQRGGLGSADHSLSESIAPFNAPEELLPSAPFPPASNVLPLHGGQRISDSL